MNRLVLKVVLVAIVAATSVWPLAALAFDGAEAVNGTAGRFEVLLAYIDPGAGGFIIVTVLGFISAAGYMARSYLARLKSMVFRGGASARERKSGEGR